MKEKPTDFVNTAKENSFLLFSQEVLLQSCACINFNMNDVTISRSQKHPALHRDFEQLSLDIGVWSQYCGIYCCIFWKCAVLRRLALGIRSAVVITHLSLYLLMHISWVHIQQWYMAVAEKVYSCCCNAQGWPRQPACPCTSWAPYFRLPELMHKHSLIVGVRLI